MLCALLYVYMFYINIYIKHRNKKLVKIDTFSSLSSSRIIIDLMQKNFPFKLKIVRLLIPDIMLSCNKGITKNKL